VFYARVKGIYFWKERKNVIEIMEKVGLRKDWNKRAGKSP
jgi:hypothetical protein